MDKKYKYWNKWNNSYEFTDSLSQAMNYSYHSSKPYYKLITGKWIEQPIPDSLNLTNTDTFHAHGSKGNQGNSRVRKVRVS